MEQEYETKLQDATKHLCDVLWEVNNALVSHGEFDMAHNVIDALAYSFKQGLLTPKATND